jgi:hypothetical protein
VRTIASFASELWMKHDAMKMMEETNKMFHEQVNDDCPELSESPQSGAELA